MAALMMALLAAAPGGLVTATPGPEADSEQSRPLADRNLEELLLGVGLPPLLGLMDAERQSNSLPSGADEGIELEVVGRWPYGPAGTVVAGEIDETAYAFMGSGGVVLVLDMTDPATPVRVGELATPGMVVDLSLSGDLLLVADWDAGLRIIDISEPASPTEVGFLYTPGIATGVAVSGSLAMVADGASGLRIIDISEPRSPADVGFLDTPGYAFGVAVSGSLALVAERGSWLRIIDISEPASPTEVGFLATPGEARRVAVSGGLALVANFLAGLRVIDISVPTSPT